MQCQLIVISKEEKGDRFYICLNDRAEGAPDVVATGIGHEGAERTGPNVDATHKTTPFVHPKPA